MAMDFGRLAELYCSLLESNDETGRASGTQFLQACHDLLAELYAAAQRLPDVRPTSADASDPVASVGPDLERRLAERLPTNLYWSVLDTDMSRVPKIGVGSLVDDLMDVYADLRPTISDSQLGPVSDDTVWTWRFGWKTHWGEHALDAIRVIKLLLDDADHPVP